MILNKIKEILEKRKDRYLFPHEYDLLKENKMNDERPSNSLGVISVESIIEEVINAMFVRQAHPNDKEYLTTIIENFPGHKHPFNLNELLLMTSKHHELASFSAFMVVIGQKLKIQPEKLGVVMARELKTKVVLAASIFDANQSKPS